MAETLAKKDGELAVRAKEGAGAKSNRLTMYQLRYEEVRKFEQMKMKYPPAKRAQMFASTSWGRYVLGSYEYV
jgi:hypothetical protein